MYKAKVKKTNNLLRAYHLHLLATTALLAGNMQMPTPVLAQARLQCLVNSQTSETISNYANYTYSDGINATNNPQFVGNSNTITYNAIRTGGLTITSSGIRDRSGNTVVGFGTVAGALSDQLVSLGFTREESVKALIAATKAVSELSSRPSTKNILIAVRDAMVAAVPEKTALINSLQNSSTATAIEIVSKVSKSVFESIGLTTAEAEEATKRAFAVIATAPKGATSQQITQSVFQAITGVVPDKADALKQASQSFVTEYNNIRLGNYSNLREGNVLTFESQIVNSGTGNIDFQIPDTNTIQQTGITGPGKVTKVSYQAITTTNQPGVSGENPGSLALSLQPGERLKLMIDVTIGEIPPTGAAVSVSLGDGCGGGQASQIVDRPETPPVTPPITPVTPPVIPPTAPQVTPPATPPVNSIQQTIVIPPVGVVAKPLTDPLGQITGCAGELLAEYRGFSVALYEPDPNDPTGGVSSLTKLIPTELPDIPNNNIAQGVEPNRENSNPFYLTNSDKGKYSFLLDPQVGQLDKGRTYILLVNTPEGSAYSQRRIRMVIGDRNGNIVAYTATSLDGKPINATDGRMSVSGEIDIEDADRVGLSLAILNFATNVCQAQEVQIIKTGDRAAAEPGDTVIYRLSIKNLSNSNVNQINITDNLPLGFKFLDKSVRGELSGQSVAVSAIQNGSNVTFQTNNLTIPSGQNLNIAYAALLTPDAIRGSGQNSAIVNGRRLDNQREIKDGPAIHKLRIQPGILSDCGTLIGRVFVDKNFDGEQQSNEPGVPNAVIFMDDGNRITTDANGLFSVANVISGYRTGVLDLTSIPGYTLAPNLRFIERNSQSRLVHLEPGGMARMNFGVTPTFKEGEKQ